MSKIMLVEDDNNLREIYGERLLAEGYEIVTAKDGEEALALAVSERPDLIISDVMMPKISGFDMLDILRQTPETRNVKVIMMTALSQAEDKERAHKLGADKYLVKSQVTLEDVARVVADVLNNPDTTEGIDTNPEQISQPAEFTTNQPVAEESSTDAQPSQQPFVAPIPPAIPPTEQSTLVTESIKQSVSVETTVEDNNTSSAPVLPTPDQTPENHPTDATGILTEQTTPSAPPVVEQDQPLQPPNNEKPDIINPITGTVPDNSPNIQSAEAETTAQEQNDIEKQIEDFVDSTQPETTTRQVEMIDPTQANTTANPTTDTPVASQPEIKSPPTLEPASSRKRVIEPINDLSNQPNITELYEQELAKEAKVQELANPVAGTSIVVDSETFANQPENPIVGALPETPIVSTPLETVDLSQIDGITRDEQSSSTNPPNEQPQIINEPTQVIKPQSSDNQTTEKPIDPNQIAL